MKTRNQNSRATAEARAESAALRSRVKRSMENAQQEEVFHEFLMLLWANGGKMPYGAVNKLVRPYNAYGFKAVTKKIIL